MVSSFAWLLFARSIQGLASSCITVAGMGMTANLYKDDEKERAEVMGKVMSGVALGVLIGYPLGGFAYEFVGKTEPFVAIAVATAAVVAAQIAYIDPEESGEEEQRSVSDSADVPVSKLIRTLLRDKNIFLVTGSVWVSTTAMAMLEPLLPIWLMRTIRPKVSTIKLPPFKIPNPHFFLFSRSGSSARPSSLTASAISSGPAASPSSHLKSAGTGPPSPPCSSSASAPSSCPWPGPCGAWSSLTLASALA